MDSLLLFVRVSRAHQDPKDAVDPGAFPSVHLVLLTVTFALSSL